MELKTIMRVHGNAVTIANDAPHRTQVFTDLGDPQVNSLTDYGWEIIDILTFFENGVMVDMIYFGRESDNTNLDNGNQSYEEDDGLSDMLNGIDMSDDE